MTTSATTASPTDSGLVAPSQRFQASPSTMSWAITTGPRAQRRSRRSDQAHHASAAPAPRKNAAVVTPIVSRTEFRLASSRTPRPASIDGLDRGQRGRHDEGRRQAVRTGEFA